MVAAVYPTFTYGDDPRRWLDGDDDAAKKLRVSTDAHCRKLWRYVEGQIDGPWFLGDTWSALDLYVCSGGDISANAKAVRRGLSSKRNGVCLFRRHRWVVRMGCPVGIITNFAPGAVIHSANRHFDHGDAVFHRADVHAQIAGDAFIIHHFENAVGRH